MRLLDTCPGQVACYAPCCRWTAVWDSHDTYAMLLMFCLIAQQRGAGGRLH